MVKTFFGVDDITSGVRSWLKKAYKIDDSYIVEIQSTYTEETLYMIFNIDLYDLTYTVDLIT